LVLNKNVASNKFRLTAKLVYCNHGINFMIGNKIAKLS